MTYPMTVVDTIFKALAPAIPDAGHRRPSRRSRGRPHQRPPAEGRQLLHLSRRPDRRRLGRQAQQRRHATRPSRSTTATPTTARASRSRRNIRCWSSATRCARIPAAPDASAAGSAPSRWCRRADEIRFNAQIDRVKCRPWGLFGGLSALGNGVAISRFGTARRRASRTARRSTRCSSRRRLHPALRRRRRLRLAARPRARRRWSATCAAAMSRRKRRSSTTARCSTRLPASSTSPRAEKRRAEMRAQGLPHDEPIADTGVPPPRVRASPPS